MSGGGQPQKGRMGSRIVEEFSADAIRMMQENVRDEETQLRAIVDRRVELETLGQKLETHLERARGDVASLRTEINAARDQIKEYKKFEAVCMKKAKEAVRDEQRQRKLEEVVEKCSNEFERADALAAKLREENNQLHEKIVEISKRLLDEPKAALKHIESRMAEANKEITDLTVEIKTAKRTLANGEKKLTGMRDDLETHRAKLAKFEERIGGMDVERTQRQDEHEAASKECEELEAEVREMSKTMKQAETQIQKLEAERIDLKHKLDDLSGKLKQAEHHAKHYENLLNELKLHNIKELLRIRGSSSSSRTSGGADSTLDGGGQGDVTELKKLDRDDLTGLDEEYLKKEMHRLKEALEAQTPNLAAIQNYKELVSQKLKIMLIIC